MPSDIPGARSILEALLSEHHNEMSHDVSRAIRKAVGLMHRAPMIRRTKVRSISIVGNRPLVARIKRLGRTTDLSHQQIGDMVRVNTGRVSEVLSGRRDDDGRMKKNEAGRHNKRKHRRRK